MLPVPIYIAIAVVVGGALAYLAIRENRQLKAAASEEDRQPHRRHARRSMGLAGLILALFPVMYGKGLFEPRASLAEYLDLAVGFTGLGIIVGAIMLFSDPEPPRPPGEDDAADADSASHLPGPGG